MIPGDSKDIGIKRKHQGEENEENSEVKNIFKMYRSLAQSEVLTRFLCGNRRCAILILQSAILAMNSSRDCYNPKYPGNLEQIKKYDAIELIDLLEDTLKYNNELKLIDILDSEMVLFVYFTLFQSRVKLNYLQDFENICEVWKFESISLADNECDEEANIKQNQVNNSNKSITTDHYFEVNGMIPLFHGSSFINLYSIFSNDLRSMSGTKLQSHGQSFGPGIYTVPLYQISTAYQYVSGKHGCLFILENQCKDLKVYRKSISGVHVLPSNEYFRIKFVLIMKNCYQQSDHSALIEHIKELWTENYDTPKKIKKYEQQIIKVKNELIDSSAPIFDNDVTNNNCTSNNNNNNNNNISNDRIKEQKSKFTATGQSRLAQESFRFQELLDNRRIDGVVFFENIEDRLDHWRVGITVNQSTKLAKDMNKYDISCIIVQFISDSTQYPFKPPFVFVEEPIFKRMTGHVVDGAVCSSVLSVSDSSTNDQAWSPAYSMDMVVQIIRMLLAEAGEGRIDPTRLNQKYNLSEARSGFQRAMTTHQW